MTALAGQPVAVNTGDTDYYRELTTRNTGVISTSQQKTLRNATVLIAGCGSTGGAAAEPLARLGVRNFLIADPGTYELNNLNRQNATTADLERNKAVVAAERILAINPNAQVHTYEQGITSDCVAELTRECDVVIDGVDVTTMPGLRAKYLLHQNAAAQRLPLIMGWDMVGAQYIRCYDYRTMTRVLDGQLAEADLDQLSMWQILKRLVPARYIPIEMFTIATANLNNPDFSFPQLVYAADLFGAMSAHMTAQILTGEKSREHTYIDVHQLARGNGARLRTALRRPAAAVSLIRGVRRTADN
jgi:hypothetical protein